MKKEEAGLARDALRLGKTVHLTENSGAVTEHITRNINHKIDGYKDNYE